MRVVSGEARGRRLKAPKNQNLTRPMADKIKEAVFGSLASLGVQPVRILDLYAGSGAVGIEALSRGGKWADFVDRNREACTTVRSNLESVGFTERGQVHQVPIEIFLERVTEPYDFIIVDPPYANANILEVLERISHSAAVEDETIVILGHWPKLEVPERIGRMVKLRGRCHGDSCFSIFDVVIEDESSSQARDEGAEHETGDLPR
jgi:16S rRNA (guanine966-N2)-methyltransferase